jgi:ATP-dependent exoDNAse (exonuclease V) beta subunit
MTDTLASRTADVTNILSSQVYISGQNASTNVAMWNTLSGALPSEMTLDELILFLAADTETDQQKILDLVNQRIMGGQAQTMTPMPKHIRILTMHGAKGLSGKVVFIPSAEQGIMPNFKALQATGLLIEQRRLFYVSLTRAMACCIISHSAQHTGAASMALTQTPTTRLTRSQFLNEMRTPSVNRAMGLTRSEATGIVNEVNNL